MTLPSRCVCLCVLLLAGCMEGQKPDPLPRTTLNPLPSLYERLGGEERIIRVVDDFVGLLLDDPRIKPIHKKHFESRDVLALKQKLVAQIGEATGGPQKYTGKNMRDAHKGMAITNDDFDALVDVLKKSLIRNKVGERERDELLGLLAPMRKDIVE